MRCARWPTRVRSPEPCPRAPALESGTTSVGTDRLMTKQIERLLKWYPSRWRARYGEELGALMEDTYGAGPVPLSSQAKVMRSGIAERVRQLGLGGAGDSPSESVRSGSLLVLCGWALFVIAGSAFAKMTEHWVGATPGPDRRLPVGAFGTIQVAAGVGLTIVVIGCAVALPTALRFLREGGWERARRPVIRGLVVSSTALLFTAALIDGCNIVGLSPTTGDCYRPWLGSHGQY